MNRAINTYYNRPLALATKFRHFKNKSRISQVQQCPTYLGPTMAEGLIIHRGGAQRSHYGRRRAEKTWWENPEKKRPTWWENPFRWGAWAQPPGLTASFSSGMQSDDTVNQ